MFSSTQRDREREVSAIERCPRSQPEHALYGFVSLMRQEAEKKAYIEKVMTEDKLVSVAHSY